MNKEVIYDTGMFCNKTFRQLLDPYISVNYWYDLGINLVMGKEADRMARPNDFMFLPDYIMEILQSARLVSGKQLILDASVPTPDRFRFSYIIPWIIVVFLVLLSLPPTTRKIVFYTVLSVSSVRKPDLGEFRFPEQFQYCLDNSIAADPVRTKPENQ
jgi:hypothetical protein